MFPIFFEVSKFFEKKNGEHCGTLWQKLGLVNRVGVGE